MLFYITPCKRGPKEKHLDNRFTQSEHAAIDFCQQLAKSHYENFPVASKILPRQLRLPIVVIYAFARIADDLADEESDAQVALHNLEEWKAKLERTISGSVPDDPVFIALSAILRYYPISPKYLFDLLTAFRRDIYNPAYPDWNSLQDYCRYSANPIGRLLLELNHSHTNALLPLSDAICSGLQLINFWQDLSVDIPRGRLYLPESEYTKYTDAPFAPEQLKPEARAALLQTLLNKTKDIYTAGRPLGKALKGRLGIEVNMIYFSGLRILQKIENMGEKIFFLRPKLNILDAVSILFRVLIHAGAKNHHKE
jgi:squalene synthase HpnC